MAKLKITWVKSAIGYPEDQKRTIQALGLNKIRQSVEFDDSGTVRGMITKVRHLVTVEAIENTAGSSKRARRSAKPVEEVSQ